jgi:hypothetical protein
MHPGSRRSTGISGIVFVVLGVVVVVLSGENDFTQTDGALRGYFVDDARQQQAVAAMLILPLALAALLWFTAGLRTLLQADARSGLPSAAALGGGFFAATFLVGVTVSNSVAVALAFMDRYTFDPHEARLTLILGIVLTTGALTGAAVMITATSLAGRTGAAAAMVHPREPRDRGARPVQPAPVRLALCPGRGLVPHPEHPAAALPRRGRP